MRRAAILVTCLVTLFAGCDLYFDDDDRDKTRRPGEGGDADASCGTDHGDGDAGFFPDGGLTHDGGPWEPWPDAGFWPDASPDW